MDTFQKIMKQYATEQKTFEQMILRFDEDISLKASKLSLTELKKHLEDKYLVATEIEKSEDQMRDRIEKADDQIGVLQEDFEKMTKQMKMLVKAEIRRAMLFKDPTESAQTSIPQISCDSSSKNQLSVQIKSVAPIKEPALSILLSQKADVSDLQELKDSKTNKHDFDLQMKALDIIHRQLDEAVILVMDLILNLINEQNLTYKEIKKQKLYLLKQV